MAAGFLHATLGMKRLLFIGLLLIAAACTPAENEGGTPIPGQGSGAPLNDEAITPSDEPADLDE
jgi:hypothetical protein